MARTGPRLLSPLGRLLRIDLEEYGLVCAVLRIRARVQSIHDTGVAPGPSAPHICHVYHREAHKALEVLGEVVKEGSARPDGPLSEELAQVVDALLIHAVEEVVGSQRVRRVQGDGGGRDVHHRRERLRRSLEVQQRRLAGHQGLFDGGVLTVVVIVLHRRVRECRWGQNGMRIAKSTTERNVKVLDLFICNNPSRSAPPPPPPPYRTPQKGQHKHSNPPNSTLTLCTISISAVLN